jgi:fructose/tagatose bisphosphate aldolase
VAHLVADAVGAPAERELGQVAGAEHDAAALVGEAEQVVGAQPAWTFSKVTS